MVDIDGQEIRVAGISKGPCRPIERGYYVGLRCELHGGPWPCDMAQLREAASLAYQALLWRGANSIGGEHEQQAAAALEALRSLGLSPLYYRRMEEERG